jgi:ABC-type branched-subunit amino acid transport system substrate-binding protein
VARRFAPTLVIASVVLLGGGACTNPNPAPSVGPTATPQSPAGSIGASLPELKIGVVADTSPASSDKPFLDGMNLAVDEVNRAGGVAGYWLALSLQDDQGEVGRATGLLRAEVRTGTPALLYVGPGAAVTPLRPDVERAGTPVLLLGGDLYTSRALFREMFQTSIPWVWQAHVIARYLVRDRRARRVAFVGEGPDARTAAATMREALTYWGGTLRTSIVGPTGSSLDELGSSDSVVVYGSLEESASIVAELKRLPRPPRIAGSESFLDQPVDRVGAPPGTTACSTYTWAGWGAPIKRLSRFDAAFERFAGHPPVGQEQQGYDAVRALTEALAETRGRGGLALVQAMEGIHHTYSSFPVDLGPDDHTFMPRDELGLFAMSGPDERLDPWQEPGTEQWRALMRAFTSDGRRTNIPDQDKPVFFPFWGKHQPAPMYWRSRYGITTRPAADPLH